jgi:DNA replication protein DnaC
MLIGSMMDTDDDRTSETERKICPICHGAGFVRLNVPVSHPQFGKAVPCSCKRQEVQEKRLGRLRQAGNLQHLEHMTFDAFQTDGSGVPEIVMSLHDALNTSREFAARPAGWLVFIGAYGCGKTHLAAAIANSRVEQQLPVLFVVVPDLLDYLRASYAPDSPATYDERFEQVRNVGMLILDDLGTQNATPWAAEKLYQILNYRYNAELPTVITMNQSLEDLDPRLASRLRDQNLVHIIPMYASDHRVQGRHEAFGSLSLYQRFTLAEFSDRRNDLEAPQRAILRSVLQAVHSYAEEPRNWLLLRGPHGVGKTHLAAAVANKVAHGGRSVMFVGVADLLDHLRATFQPGSPVSYDQRFNEVRRAWLLVLDDLGTQSATPWAQEKLFQVLNHRYVAGLPTILTISDENWGKLEERLQSRLLDTAICTSLELSIPSYRGQTKPARKPMTSTRQRT